MAKLRRVSGLRRVESVLRMWGEQKQRWSFWQLSERHLTTVVIWTASEEVLLKYLELIYIILEARLILDDRQKTALFWCIAIALVCSNFIFSIFVLPQRKLTHSVQSKLWLFNMFGVVRSRAMLTLSRPQSGPYNSSSEINPPPITSIVLSSPQTPDSLPHRLLCLG